MSQFFKILVGLIVVAGVALLAFLWQGRAQKEDDVSKSPEPCEIRVLEPKEEREPSNEGAFTEDRSGENLIGYGTPEVSPLHDLALIFDCIEQFQITLQGRSELPAGSNKELTGALLGANNDRVRFVSPKGTHINAEAELVDRWQSPYFFHFVDDSIPQIRSAGPDQKMWTKDDLLFE